MVCEVGDLIIAIKDGPSTGTVVVNADWTVAQTNIDGSVTTTGTLTANTIILGNGTREIKSLANGSNGQVLKLVSGMPTWSTDIDTWREIKVSGVSQITASSSTALDFAAGAGIGVAGHAQAPAGLAARDRCRVGGSACGGAGAAGPGG